MVQQNQSSHLKQQLLNRLDSRKEEMIQIRRHLHQHPELSFKEEKNCAVHS